jgi:tetratricopeptide (TPR) repeat protein
MTWNWIAQPLRVTGLAALGLALGGGAVMAQVLVRPPVPDTQLMQQQGLQLAGEAVRLAQFGQIDIALNRIELAAQLAPDTPEIKIVLGTLQLQQGNYNEAVKALQEAREQQPENSDLLLSLGSAYVRQGSYFAALDTLKRGLELDPKNLQGLFDLGNAYLLLENYDEARGTYEKAIAIDKEFWPAINNIGLLEYQLGNIDAAIEQFKASIAIDDGAAEPLLALGTALYVQGDTEQALKLGVRAMQADFTYGDVQTLRDNLWGDRLVTDVQVLLNTEPVRNALNQAKADNQLQKLDSAF